MLFVSYLLLSSGNPATMLTSLCFQPFAVCAAQPSPLWQKAVAGLTAGGLGALVGSPADLSLIRMQADATVPLAQRRNYKGVGDAMVRRCLFEIPNNPAFHNLP